MHHKKTATLESDGLINKYDSAAEKYKSKTEYEQLIDNIYHDKILIRLLEYEQTLFFLDPNITLSKVAVNIDTNTATVSKIINKNINFSTYISASPIEYIINEIGKNQKLTSYKISYLANLCGFRSHSTFTKAFKNIKGICPSEFIEGIQAKL